MVSSEAAAGDGGDLALDMFHEPSGYFEPEKTATHESHKLLSGKEISVRLVGHNPLWGHHLWNAGRVVSHYLEENADTLVRGRTVLELGAASGLPSLICAMCGADKVVVTDYPDAELVDNLEHNIASCRRHNPDENICALGYLWGSPTGELSSKLPAGQEGFDILILADVVFNHSEHAKLIDSVRWTLKQSALSKALVFFTPYRPWLLQKDLAFFDLARSSGFVVNKVLEKVMDKVMFEKDRGDELLRRTVYGYELVWAPESIKDSSHP